MFPPIPLVKMRDAVCSSSGMALDDSLPPIHINRASGPIVVDGDLAEAGWQNATKFETWYETNPGDNIEPKVKQVGYVAYDDHFLYVGVDMWDPNPSQINSIYGDHDALSGNTDDYAGLLIDSRNDKKTGYLFLVNAHGIQYDASTDDASGELMRLARYSRRSCADDRAV